ncbi:MAG TPA: hypothetical protein VEC93_01765 [Anaerolineae bacterium]|nr:hypothetical protein [Anaerolineae bacterium]
MSRKFRHTHKPTPSRQLPWLPIIAGGAILLVIVGLAIWWTSFSSAPMTAPQTGDGAPRLAVDRTTIDDGYVKFETPIQAAFKLSNTGNQPLQILSEPQVQLVEGC